MSDEEFLRVDDVWKRFPLKGGGAVQALRGVSLSAQRGRTLGIVGESGCGKSTLGRVMLHLMKPDAGHVRVDGDVLDALRPADLRHKRRTMQMIFQDPQASLDPRMKVRELIEEPLVIHRAGDAVARRRRVDELLDIVRLPIEAAARYPHEFSGGQRQRISIARALALSPSLVIADEPVSALDVSIQAQILNLLAELRQAFGLTYVFISHDLAVIRHISDTVAVLYLGQVMEWADVDALFERPAHPYTRTLLAAALDTENGFLPHDEGQPSVPAVMGEPPSPENPPPGCPFHPRCPLAMDRCAVEQPPEIVVEPGALAPHMVRCWLHA